MDLMSTNELIVQQFTQKGTKKSSATVRPAYTSSAIVVSCCTEQSSTDAVPTASATLEALTQMEVQKKDIALQVSDFKKHLGPLSEAGTDGLLNSTSYGLVRYRCKIKSGVCTALDQLDIF